MKIKKRLFISNILMIIIPVVISALVGAGCVWMVWFTVTHGAGLGFEDSEDFFHASHGISEVAEIALRSGADERQGRLAELSRMLDRGAMSLTIERDGVPFYSYGTAESSDPALIESVKVLGGEGITSDGERSLYSHRIKLEDGVYALRLFSSRSKPSYMTLKIVAALAAALLIAAVFLSVLFTNRFLTRFVFRRIEEPLDILTGGVRRIRDGDLECLLDYRWNDEFAQVCSDFNEMASRLKESVERTRKQSESRKELMAGISHDLRSPLTSILAYAEGLLEGVAATPEASKKYLETIRDKARDIDKMVSQIFMFSKLEFDEYAARPETLRLDETVGEMISEVMPEYKTKGLDIRFEPVPAVVSADPCMLRRMLINIMDNSVKYKNKEVCLLVVRLEIKDRNCLLSLTDDGPGVPEEAIPKLFDVFYRSDPSRVNPAGGSGLGLAVVAGAARLMGCSAGAVNVEGGGLSIIITMPEVRTV